MIYDLFYILIAKLGTLPIFSNLLVRKYRKCP